LLEHDHSQRQEPTKPPTSAAISFAAVSNALDLFTAWSLLLRDFLICRSAPQPTEKSPPPSVEQLSLVLESKTKINPLIKQTQTTRADQNNQKQ
jgi:hypothetical protein